jgi:hypothetical protein
MPESFENLRNRLLEGGAAPRHVERYLKELAEHLEDLVAEELESDCGREAAKLAALRRLGDTDSLADAMIGHKAFRSWSHRAPWCVYLLAPLVVVLATNIVTMIVLATIVRVMGSRQVGRPLIVPGWFEPFFTAFTAFVMLLLPLVLSWGISHIAVRQRMRPFWPILGLIVVAACCGLTTYDLRWSSIPHGLDAISSNSPAFWPLLPSSVGITLPMAMRVLINFGFTFTLYWACNRRRSRIE